MNLSETRYNRFSLVKEMLESVEVIRRFDAEAAALPFVKLLREEAGDGPRFLLTGEGSSRILPANQARTRALQLGANPSILVEGATDALDYNLEQFVVLGSSNSGRTKELLRLFRKLRSRNHPFLFSVTANTNTPLEAESRKTYVLGCGPEQAVAATKSVVEQVLFFEAFFTLFRNEDPGTLGQADLSRAMLQALTMPLDPGLVSRAAAAPVLYIAGRNDGVAEELALKTNEIARKPAVFLPGTYLLHGIEEVLSPEDVLVLVDPFPEEEEKIQEVLGRGVGMDILAISARETLFPTLRIPALIKLEPLVRLAAGWNLLVELGLSLDIDLDRPRRARKIGNEAV